MPVAMSPGGTLASLGPGEGGPGRWYCCVSTSLVMGCEGWEMSRLMCSSCTCWPGVSPAVGGGGGLVNILEGRREHAGMMLVARALAACLTENLTFSYSSHLPKVGWNDS